ncbi:dienelactone hydrolase family protein [Rhodopila sp.]|uniref:dienelactone hydrolase family protein n=1 Tax=Rhodopila sp. TaxID=2480087 RepID=UPI002D165C82|nr:prolyl oligopeptidase family serine peptidase [Rhodopila sp.]HVZ07531.1 prolyl oligopeptidase family serine peptidase [Rhodopila sp.]
MIRVGHPVAARALAAGLLIHVLSSGPAPADSETAGVAVHFPAVPATTGPHELAGILRRPAGAGRFPAAVLLHGCGGDAQGLDRNWGALIQSWGYVILTVDSFGPRGITNSCRTGPPPGRVLDADSAYRFLATQGFVDPSRIALIGFSEGGVLALLQVDAEQHPPLFGADFAAAAAFYPLCAESGTVTVPTLVLNGTLDDWSRIDACRRMVRQENDIGITRHPGPSAPLALVALPGAYHKFDDPTFQPGRRYMGHMLEYNAVARAQAAGALRAFLTARLGDAR